MPSVKSRESRKDFVSRCIPIVIREGATQAHAVAKCNGIYEQARKVTTNRTQVVPSNPLKADPTRTATLRRVFTTDISVRFARLKRKVWRLIVEQDAFGLTGTQNKERENDQLVQGNGKTGGQARSIDESDGSNEKGRGQTVLYNQRGKVGFGREARDAVGSGGTGEPGESNSERTDALNVTSNTSDTGRTCGPANNEQYSLCLFEKWLKTQIQSDIITVTEAKAQDAYWKKYVEEGYKKGAGRAFDDVRKPALASGQEQLDFFAGTRDEFLRQSFARPVAIAKVKHLAGRVFTGLKDVTDDMSNIITRQLTEGLSQGMNPKAIARKMIKEGIGTKTRGVQSRAERIARTEIIRAHAEGQLDSLESLGVTEVGVMVEWSAAGDDRVCPLCQALDGVVLTIKEARGIIPRHPNCRCAHIPANVGESKKGQERSKTEIKGAFDDSIAAERKKGTLAEKRKKSQWFGADKTIAPKRPTSVLGKPVTTKPTKKPAVKEMPLKLSKEELTAFTDVEEVIDIVELQLQGGQLLKEIPKVVKKISREKTRRWISGFTRKQRRAFGEYTSGGFSAIRNCLENRGTCKGITKSHLSALKTAMKKAPKFEGVSYRGLNLSKGEAVDFLAGIKKNSGLTDKSFMSTSRSLPAARSFSQKKGKAVRIILKLEGKTGADIATISDVPRELEVLFSPGSKFKLKSIGLDSGIGKFDKGTGDILVTLVEVL